MTYTVISRPKCSWCDKAMDLLTDNDIDFEKIDMTQNPWVRTLVVMADFATVPQVFDHNGFYIGGYEELAQHINNLDIYQ